MSNATSENIVIGGTAFYSSVHTPNKMSEAYQMDIGQLDGETKKRLEGMGITLKNKADERGDYVTAKSEFAPKVLDADKKEISQDILVGNGSTVKVVVTPYNWTFKSKSGTSLGLRVVQVIDLVEYTDPNLELLDNAD